MSFTTSFGETILELPKEAIKKNPDKPIVKMYDKYDDETELIGVFSLETLEIIEDIDLADYDIRFAQETMKRNQVNWLETWYDYVDYFRLLEKEKRRL